MKKPILLFSLFASFCLLMPRASPAGMSVDYSLESSGITFQLTQDPGLVVQAASVLSPDTLAFTLNDGESHQFDLFEIWTDEASLQLDDYLPSLVQVDLRFSSPASGTGTIGGTLSGLVFGTSSKLQWWKWISGGEVAWQPIPLVVVVPDHVIFTVELTPGSFNSRTNNLFNSSKGDLRSGQAYAATIQAKVTQIWSADPQVVINTIPEPGTILSGLLCFGLLGGVRLAVARCRRAG